jgi:amino acid adenylation domain-containing protein
MPRPDAMPSTMDAERKPVAERFAFGPAAPPRRTLADLLKEPVHRQPLAPALAVVSTGESTRLNYAELDARSNRLARQLLAGGLALGDTAAVLLPRQVDLVVALLACVKAGIAYCPLDPMQPASRLAQMVRTSRARKLLTDRAGAESFATDISKLLLDAPETRAAVDAQPATPVADAERGAALQPESIAYVIFTSGSTGVPKGVAVSHGAIAQTVQAYAAELTLQSGQSVISVISIGFDPATLDLFAALSRGALLVLLDEAARRDPFRIHEATMAYPDPVLAATPSVWRTLPLEMLPPSLTAISGGEPFPQELLPRMRRLRGVINAYGPTEAAVMATFHRLGTQDGVDQAVPVGRPAAGSQVWIIDRGLQPVPLGAIGELCIGGAALAAGYVGEPALTEAAFPPSPFGPGRIYRTGDLARWRADGRIELLGRIDDQVKISGHRIEPTEVEHVLRTLPWVADAAILAHGKSPQVRLVAYVVPRPGERMPPLADIRAALADRLPSWMLPASCVSLPALPRTATGKLDRNALPEVPAPAAAEREGRAPQSPDQVLLCDLFARVTGHTAVDADSDFFEIGGDSLDAMILVTELRQLGRDLPLASLFSGRTPAAIAAAWQPRSHGEPATIRPTLFLIPGNGGDDPRLAALRVDWADMLDCVLLDYPDWPRLAAPGFGMDDLVADIAQRILDHVPARPLVLVGYSLGGFVAWAVAKRLAATAQPVDVLCIIDSNVGNLFQVTEPGRPISGMFRRLHALATALRTRDGAEAFKMLGEVIGYRLAHRPALLRVLAKFRHLRLPSALRYWLRLFLCGELQIRMVDSWKMQWGAGPQPLDCRKVVLFQAAEDQPDTPPGLGWAALCGALETEKIEGDHMSLLNKRDPNSLHSKLPKVLAGLLEGASTLD